MICDIGDSDLIIKIDEMRIVHGLTRDQFVERCVRLQVAPDTVEGNETVLEDGYGPK